MHRGYKTDATARVLAQTPHALAGRSQWSRKTPIRAAAASAIRNVVQCTQTGGGLWKLSRRLLHHLMVSFSAVSEACTCSRRVGRDHAVAAGHRLGNLCSLPPPFSKAAHPRIRHKRSSCAEPVVAPAAQRRPSGPSGCCDRSWADPAASRRRERTRRDGEDLKRGTYEARTCRPTARGTWTTTTTLCLRACPTTPR